MNQIVKRNVLLFVCLLLLGGCAELRPYNSEPVGLREPSVTEYLLSCLNDIHDTGAEEFSANFKMAENSITMGNDLAKLNFICLSLHAKADYRQFKQGTRVLEQYIDEHPESPSDILGFQILIDRLDKEIITKWSAWKSLLEENDELKIKVESSRGKLEQDQVLIEKLQKQLAQDKALIGELQSQIEQLKNIENIIKSRETEQ
jgi:predicted RNase H-like nuclease (RuvC/YqgF family)